MLKTLKCGKGTYCTIQKALIQKRSFLSEAYRCEKAWQSRLETPLLKKIKPQNLSLDIEHKHITAGKVNALDIDIFANTVLEKYQVEELLTSIHNLRLTAETSNTLESTHHAVIRYLLDNDFTEDIINVLHDRLNYGIFPDHLCYNILMDTYIKKKDYVSAAKIAVLPMLQEDYENQITNALSVYSCYKYLEKPDDWPKPPVSIDDSKEEIKIRVDYLRNPFFDDHFDLTDPRDLVGKTLAFYGKIMNNTLGRTCQLRGLILYKKYQDILELIEKWLRQENDNIIYEEIFELIKKDNENLPVEEMTDEFKNVMSQVEKLKTVSLCKDNLIQALENEIKCAVDKQSETDINEQIKKYIVWGEQRQNLLNEQLEQINREKRIQNIKQIKKKLQEQEQLLTFFDKEEEIELEIEHLEEKDKEEMERVLKMHHAVKKLKQLETQAEYIPPTVTK
ncbi:28S ribosomal protein S27, mitochondrial-like [Colletes gigas]|uniref:28S ribosomal protein S27, mitochondrial-like n=1 Tax=Colletes gigas TaxID=935657 RepID=UPI001C9B6F08|nr:28S ribosomal protein S27, mitochondrial-like [Colletes gigas]